ncbi:hypothetical protein CMV_020282 [Castanea mollissima]|uniref:Uncharacterized protein n=1 Tax=Castanea mollissima TaxID=60419 RepID=A0A8J4QNH0_9ROSI|nr:hypothetical protein CMV_020282 [Castanea mollissima]
MGEGKEKIDNEGITIQRMIAKSASPFTTIPPVHPPRPDRPPTGEFNCDRIQRPSRLGTHTIIKLFGFRMMYTAIDNFYLTDEQLKNSPSRKDGIDEATETTLRIYGCDLIQKSSILLKLPQVVATG